MPSCGASNGCRTRQHPARSRPPSGGRSVLPRGKVWRRADTAREQKCAGIQVRGLDPRVNRFACWLGDLELHRTFRLLLHDNSARRDLIAVGNIQDAKLHKIASAELRINGEVEQSQIPSAVPQLKPDPDSPDVAQLQRRLLADELVLVPWLMGMVLHRSLQSGLRWCASTRCGGANVLTRDSADHEWGKYDPLLPVATVRFREG